MDVTLQAHVLGPVDVASSGEPIPIGGPKQRTALALIVNGNGAVVSIDRIIGGIYGDNVPDRAKRSVHTYVSNLRGAMGDAIQSRGRGYFLDTSLVDVDAITFRRLVREAIALVAADPGNASEQLRDALALWKGRVAYADVDAHGLLAPARTQLEELRLQALAARIDADLRLGRHADLIPELSSLIDRHPLFETFRGHLMLALYRAGRQIEALRVFDAARRLLVEEAGLDPSPSLVELRDAILEQDPALKHPTLSVASLPNRMTTFVGRSKELDAVAQLLRTHRMVTIHGPGGVGKTSLAVEAARHVMADFGDVAFVALSAASEGYEVLNLVARAVGVDARLATDLEDMIGRTIGSSSLLLLLDTCEHVVEPATSLASTLLARCPHLTIVATSRRRLKMSGERLFELGPLRAERGTTRSAAVELLIDRIRLLVPTIEMTPAKEQALDIIAKRLDGLPLALELAAARAKWFGLDALSTELQQGGESVVDETQNTADERQSSLVKTVEWSVGMLSEDGQTAFAALSVFRGNFSTEEASLLLRRTSVSSSPQALMSELLDAALLANADQDGGRHVMLDTVRAVGARRLAAAVDLAAVVRRAHADNILTTLRAAPDNFDLAAALDVDAEANLMSATSWASATDPQMAVDLAAAAAPWYWIVGSRPTGYELLNSVARQLASVDVGWQFARWASMFATYYGHDDSARRWIDTAEDAARRSGDPAALSSCLRARAFADWSTGRNGDVADLYEQALQIAIDNELPAARGAVMGLANLAVYEGDASRVDEVADRYADLARRFGWPDGRLRNKWLKSLAALLRGDHEEALQLVDAAVDGFPATSSSFATACLVRARLRLWEGDSAGAWSDLAAVEAAGHLTDAPWAMEFRLDTAHVRAFAFRSDGEYSAAAAMLRAAMRESLEHRHVAEVRTVHLPELLLQGALLTEELGQRHKGTTLAAFTRSYHQSIGKGITARAHEDLTACEDRLRDALGPDAYSAATAAAESLTLRAAIDFAIDALAD